jgi:hypothetical protein
MPTSLSKLEPGDIERAFVSVQKEGGISLKLARIVVEFDICGRVYAQTSVPWIEKYVGSFASVNHCPMDARGAGVLSYGLDASGITDYNSYKASGHKIVYDLGSWHKKYGNFAGISVRNYALGVTSGGEKSYCTNSCDASDPYFSPVLY